MLARLKQLFRKVPALIDLPEDGDVRVQRREISPGHERVVVDIFTKVHGRFPSKHR